MTDRFGLIAGGLLYRKHTGKIAKQHDPDFGNSKLPHGKTTGY
jgi:hypothetical protein